MIIWQASCVVNREEVDIEDSGTALITEVVDDNDQDAEGFFVRLHSWIEPLKDAETWETAAGHSLFQSLIDKRVTVTVELAEETKFDAGTMADILIEKLTGKYGDQYARHLLVSALGGAHYAGMKDMREFYYSQQKKKKTKR